MTNLTSAPIIMDELISGPQGLTLKTLTFEECMKSFFPGHCQEFFAIMRDLLSRCESICDLDITQIGVFGESLVDHLENEMHDLRSEVGDEAYYRDVDQNILVLITSPQFFLWSIAKYEGDHVMSTLFPEIQDEIETHRAKEEAIILEIMEALDALSQGAGMRFKERLDNFFTSRVRPLF